MYLKNIGKRLQSFIPTSVFSIVLLLLTESAYAGLFGSDCPEANVENKPQWVKDAYNINLPGFRFGFGEARYKGGKSYEDLLKEAELNAREHLASSIIVTIDATTNIHSNLSESGDSSTSFSRFDSTLKSQSKVELPGLPIYDKWQNPSSCTMFVLVRLKEEVVDLVLRNNQATAYHKRAKRSDLPVGERILAVREAISLAEGVEFGNVQGADSSAQRLRLFNHTLSSLLQLQSKFNNAVVVINNTGQANSEVLNPLLDILRTAIPGSFDLPNECSSSTMCLAHANKTSANYASIADVQMETVKQNGFWVGNFVVRVSLWDLKNNHQLYSSDVLPTRVMHRHKHKLSMESALSKWLRQHEPSLSEFVSAAKKL